MTQFRTTRNLYLEYLTGFEFPLTYESWLKADDEYKAVLLFVNFFDVIELAWYKTRYSYVLEEDAISQVNVYLMKNVPFIKEDEKRFKAGYIYRVASNCLKSLTYIDRDRNREKFDTPNEVAVDGDVVNLYDLVPAEDDSYEVQQAREALWDIIEGMDPKAKKVINKLLNPSDSLLASKKNKGTDALADVSVSSAEFAEILEQLKNNAVLASLLETACGL